MENAPVITVDGPSGSGKGTLSRRLARALQWRFLDSGALYRLVAVDASRRRLSPDVPAQLERAAQAARLLEVVFDEQPDGRERILLEGVDVTARVRAEETGNLASRFARRPEIRAALLERQRAFRDAPGLVADGRDMGTVVFPDARLKFFITASAEERARRRVAQLKQMGTDANIDRIFSEIAARDERDSQREHSPLHPAEDAVMMDTSTLSIEAVVANALAEIKRKGLIN